MAGLMLEKGSAGSGCKGSDVKAAVRVEEGREGSLIRQIMKMLR